MGHQVIEIDLRSNPNQLPEHSEDLSQSTESQESSSQQEQDEQHSQDDQQEQSSQPGQSGQQEQSGQQDHVGQQEQGGQQGQSGQSGQSEQQDQSSQQDQVGQQEQGGQLGQSGQQGQSSQSGQAGQQGQSSQSGQVGQQGQSGQPGQIGQQGQSSQSGQIGQQSQSSQPGQDGPSGQSDQQSQGNQSSSVKSSGQSGQDSQIETSSQGTSSNPNETQNTSIEGESSSEIETSDSNTLDSQQSSEATGERTRNSTQQGEGMSSSKKTIEKKSQPKIRDHLKGEPTPLDLLKEQIEKPQRSEATNQFLGQLEQLPSFKERSHGGSYSIDTESDSEVPESVVRTLISKFLNQRFCKRVSDLNIRSNALEKADGFYKWDIKKIVRHLETAQLTKVINDKYGYQYAQGKYESVPLSFYFDLSGSMSSYTNMLAVMAIELLKKDVKVLVGFNQTVHVQIEQIPKQLSVSELADFLTAAGSYYSDEERYQQKSKGQIKYRVVDEDLDTYLIDKKAEKCVVFADCDPLYSVVRLSQKAQVYWFNFESNFSRSDLSDYKGFVYEVHCMKDIQKGLIKVNENRFEALTYIDNPKVLRR